MAKKEKSRGKIAILTGGGGIPGLNRLYVQFPYGHYPKFLKLLAFVADDLDWWIC